MSREGFSRLLSHLTDAEGVKQALQSPLFAGSDGLYRVPGGFLPHPLQFRQLILGQKVQVCWSSYQPFVYELAHNCWAHAIDIHGIPAGKMSQVPMELGRTFRAGTPQGGAVLIPDHRRAAHRTSIRQTVGPGTLRPEFLANLHHLGNDLTSLLEHHGVAHADVLLINKILVVESGVSDGGSRQTHRFHHHFWCEYTCPANLNHNVQHPAGPALRRILIGNGPTRTFGSTPDYRTI